MFCYKLIGLNINTKVRNKLREVNVRQFFLSCY